MTYQELCALSLGELKREPCRCVICGDCNGSGQVRVRTGGFPEWELETCGTCYGYGTVETCDRCQLLEEGEDS